MQLSTVTLRSERIAGEALAESWAVLQDAFHFTSMDIATVHYVLSRTEEKQQHLGLYAQCTTLLY
jgi:hypothetical protein